MTVRSIIKYVLTSNEPPPSDTDSMEIFLDMLKWRDTPDLRYLFRLPLGAKVNKRLAKAPYLGHPHLSVPGSPSPMFLQEELFWEDSFHRRLDTLTYIPSPVILPSLLTSRTKTGTGNSICKLEPHPRGRGTRVLYYKHAIRDGEWNQLDPLALIRVYGLPLATFSRNQIPTNVQAVAPVLPTAKHETRRWKNTRAQDEHAPVLSHWSLSATFPPRVERDQFCWNFQAIVQRITRANPLIRALGVAVHSGPTSCGPSLWDTKAWTLPIGLVFSSHYGGKCVSDNPIYSPHAGQN